MQVSDHTIKQRSSDGRDMFVRNAVGILLTVVTTIAVAQIDPASSRIYGPTDRDIPTPQHSIKTISDISALQQFVDFVRVSRVSGWKGLTAKGTITFSADIQSYPAHLYLRDSTASRLDVDKSEGIASTVFAGSTGAFKGPNSRLHVSSDLSQLGLVVFPRLLSPDYPTKNSILADHGVVRVGNISLHRISLDDPAIDATGDAWKTIDLYFDPTTNYLVESVSFVHLSSSDAARYMVETSYEDYRDDNSINLPHRIVQSLNGNIEWTLQLDQLDLTAVPAGSIFSF